MFIIGIALYIVALINFAKTPLNGPIVITFIGVCFASASWILLFLFVLYSRLHHITTIAVKRFCLEKYGDAYPEYMNKTHKYIEFPKKMVRKSYKANIFMEIFNSIWEF